MAVDQNLTDALAAFARVETVPLEVARPRAPSPAMARFARRVWAPAAVSVAVGAAGVVIAVALQSADSSLVGGAFLGIATGLGMGIAWMSHRAARVWLVEAGDASQRAQAVEAEYARLLIAAMEALRRTSEQGHERERAELASIKAELEALRRQARRFPGPGDEDSA